MEANELRQIELIAKQLLIVANNEKWRADDWTRILAELALKATAELKAAPLLLAACEKALHLLDIHALADNDARRDLRAAIAAARGEAAAEEPYLANYDYSGDMRALDKGDKDPY